MAKKKQSYAVGLKEDFQYTQGYLYYVSVVFITEYDGLQTTHIQRYAVVANDSKQAKARVKSNFISYGYTPKNLRIRLYAVTQRPVQWISGEEFGEKIKK